MYQRGRAWIELNLSHLAHNIKQFQKILPEKCAIMPALKANAYGHGAVLMGRALENMGISDFCVASIGEAIELRNAGITGQILVLGYTSPYQFSELSRYRLTQTVIDLPYARQLNDFGEPLCVHVSIDTGMRRLGERSDDMEQICQIFALSNLRITGVFSHLCAADGSSETDRQFTLTQIRRFNDSVDFLHRQGISGFKTHLQGSYGVLNYPEWAYDYARIGIALYGVLSSSADAIAAEVDLKPVLSLKSRIECVKELHKGESVGYGLTFTAAKEMKIAAVSIGYADGIPRELSNKGHVLVQGKKAAIIGRICMDQLLIDASDLPCISSGEEVILIGTCQNQAISAVDIADCANTISNEILSRLGNRLERIPIDTQFQS